MLPASGGFVRADDGFGRVGLGLISQPVAWRAEVGFWGIGRSVVAEEGWGIPGRSVPWTGAC